MNQLKNLVNQQKMCKVEKIINIKIFYKEDGKPGLVLDSKNIHRYERIGLLESVLAIEKKKLLKENNL